MNFCKNKIIIRNILINLNHLKRIKYKRIKRDDLDINLIIIFKIKYFFRYLEKNIYDYLLMIR